MSRRSMEYSVAYNHAALELVLAARGRRGEEKGKRSERHARLITNQKNVHECKWVVWSGGWVTAESGNLNTIMTHSRKVPE